MKIILSCLELVVTLLSISGVLAVDNPDQSNKTSFLRGGGIIANNASGRGLNPMFCGCAGCDEAALDVFAGPHKCGGRINYLQNSLGFSERDACSKIGGVEFPVECGVCDPDSCNSPPLPPPPPPPPSTGKCGCPECEDVWNTMAGDFSCGVRIEWLQSEMSTIVGGPYEESVACSKVASGEYPTECGKCDPSRCNNTNDITTNPPSKSPTPQPTKTPTEEPTNPPTKSPTKTPTKSPTVAPTRSPTKTPTQSPTKIPTESPVDNNNNNSSVDDNTLCGCSTCDNSVLSTFAGAHKCGDRISHLQNSLGFSERNACSKVAGTEYPVECGACDPDSCDRPNYNNNNDNNSIDNNNNNNNSDVSSGQKCGGAVDSSSDSATVCQRDLWNPTGDSTMHCFAYGGIGDPCHLSNNNDPNDGQSKDPSSCFGDTFYLWDEPDTQGRSYDWAGRAWLEYSRKFATQLQELKARGTRITSPMLKAGGPGVLKGNLGDFFDSCGSPCTDPSDPAYVDVIAINAFCGDFNGPDGCRGGAAFIYDEAIATSDAFGNIPVYITNWSRLQTDNPQDQVDAINAIEEFFPSSASTNPVVERIYWFGATDFGGGSSNNFLTQVLADGSTLGEVWRSKCDSL